MDHRLELAAADRGREEAAADKGIDPDPCEVAQRWYKGMVHGDGARGWCAGIRHCSSSILAPEPEQLRTGVTRREEKRSREEKRREDTGLPQTASISRHAAAWGGGGVCG